MLVGFWTYTSRAGTSALSLAGKLLDVSLDPRRLCCTMLICNQLWGLPEFIGRRNNRASRRQESRESSSTTSVDNAEQR